MSSTDIETRTRILDAARQLLEERRGQGVRMSDIARTAGLSRQAIYLHFQSRADLLAATTRYIDELLDLEQRLARSRSAASGVERLDAYIDAWGNYIPHIYSVAKALLVAQETDQAAAAAWNDRMTAMRDGCRAAIEALQKDGQLAETWSAKRATDFLWTLLSVRNWEQLTQQCGWSSRQYISRIQSVARCTFVRDQ